MSRDGHTVYDDFDDTLREIAARYGTPAYVYEIDRVQHAASELRRSLPEGADLFYSLKANPHDQLVGELAAAGLRMEISSLGELDVLVASGVTTATCLYTGPGKSLEAMRQALRAGVRLFSVESETELHRLRRATAECGTDAEYLVRINADRTGGGAPGLRMTGSASQFGIDLQLALDAPQLFEPTVRLCPVGLHFYPATNIKDPVALGDEFEASIRTAALVMRRTSMAASLIDLGGGFGAPYATPGDLPDYTSLRQRVTTALDAHIPGWRNGRPTVAFESGRYLTATCGDLLTTVMDVKESRGKSYVVLDAGVNVLGGMSGLGRVMAPASHPRSLSNTPDSAARAGGIAANRARAETTQASLVGPLCTPLDILSRTSQLSLPAPGDVWVIPNAGAYGLTASLLGFLSHPVAAEVVTDKGTVRHARRLTLTTTRFEGVDSE
jgi:diaminopimelate decarboxylase